MAAPSKDSTSVTRLAAALVSPWPTWWVEGPTEADVLERLARHGACPQADLLEPWDDEPFQARVVRPSLDDPGSLLEDGVLIAGEAPGLTEWRDRGRLIEQWVQASHLRARLTSDAHSGQTLFPTLEERAVPSFAATWLSTLPLDAKAHTTQVFQPSTGRRGYRFDVAVPGVEPEHERRSVLESIEALELDINPILLWRDSGNTLTFVAWTLHPPEPSRPEAPLALRTLDLTKWIGGCELQLPLAAETHDSEVLRISAELESKALRGTRPRWHGPQLLACWSTDTGLPAPSLSQPLRWVASCPPGLEEAWLGIDPTWWEAGQRQFMELFDPLHDRSWWPRVRPRDVDAVDKGIIARLGGLGTVEPVEMGVAGLRVQLPLEATNAFEAVLAALGHHPDPRLGPVVWVRFTQKLEFLMLRTDLDAEQIHWTNL